jgi:hemerythrin
MFEKIHWQRGFLCGNKEIDLQHQYFTEFINRLSDNLSDRDTDEYHSMLLLELSKYAHFHFQSEENIFYKIGCPDLENHRKLHTELIDKLNAKAGAFESGKAHRTEFLAFLKDWLVNHDMTEDKKSLIRVLN